MFEISVIIPTYNPGDYINECINSLYNQTFPLMEFEILVILNGNVHEYEEKVNKLLKKAPVFLKTKLLLSNSPGVSNARNMGIDNANGKFICFIDDDDVVSPNYLSSLYSKADKDTIVISNVYSFKRNIEEKSENFFICSQLRQKDKFYKGSLFRNRSFLAFPVAKIIHRDIIGNRRFDIRFKNGEDALFITSLTDKIKNIEFTDNDAIYYVRERIGSASRKKIPVSELLKTSLLLIGAYTSLYIKSFPHYNLALFFSRIPGVLKNAIHLYYNNHKR